MIKVHNVWLYSYTKSLIYFNHNVWIYSYHYKEIEVNYRNKILYLINERKKVEKAEEEKRNVREGAET